jgi:hypothetical protein
MSSECNNPSLHQDHKLLPQAATVVVFQGVFVLILASVCVQSYTPLLSCGKLILTERLCLSACAFLWAV